MITSNIFFCKHF